MPASEAERLEKPERLQWLPPDEVLASLPLQPGMTVADIGAGTGYFSLPIAKAIGAKGKVFAVDIQHEMLTLLRHKLDRPDAPRNVELVHGEAQATTLENQSCDLIFLANVWHELPNHNAALQEINRVRKLGATLAVLDWRPDVEQPPGPPLEHRIAAAVVRQDLETHGLKCEQSFNIGLFSYMVLAR